MDNVELEQSLFISTMGLISMIAESYLQVTVTTFLNLLHICVSGVERQPTQWQSKTSPSNTSTLTGLYFSDVRTFTYEIMKPKTVIKR